MTSKERARRLLIALCSDEKGISIPLRKTIEEAESMIAQEIASTDKQNNLWIAKTGPELAEIGLEYAIGEGDREIAYTKDKETALLLTGKEPRK